MGGCCCCPGPRGCTGYHSHLFSTSPIDVEPGAPRSTIVNCNLENPSVHQVKVEIRIQAGNLAYSGPASVTVGNGLSASFQVTLRADLLGHLRGSQTVAITAEVTQANGVPVTELTFDVHCVGNH